MWEWQYQRNNGIALAKMQCDKKKTKKMRSKINNEKKINIFFHLSSYWVSKKTKKNKNININIFFSRCEYDNDEKSKKMWMNWNVAINRPPKKCYFQWAFNSVSFYVIKRNVSFLMHSTWRIHKNYRKKKLNEKYRPKRNSIYIFVKKKEEKVPPPLKAT